MSQAITEALVQLQPVLEPVFVQLRPVVKKLPPQLVQYGRELYTRPVFDTIVMKLDWFSADSAALFNLFIATSLSYAIIAFGGIIKLPQIVSILKNSSASGISLVSVLLDTLSQMITVAYNFRQGNPFTTFGETAFVVLQNTVIMILVLYYNDKAKFINLFAGLMSLVAYSLLGADSPSNIGVLSNQNIKDLIKCTVPLTILSKLPQIIQNFKQKSTGQLSGVSVGASLLGTLVRVFTVLSSGIKDNMIIVGFIVNFALNLVLFLQILSFKKSKVSTEKKNK